MAQATPHAGGSERRADAVRNDTSRVVATGIREIGATDARVVNPATGAKDASPFRRASSVSFASV